MQLTLLRDSQKSREIERIATSAIEISAFNPRCARPDESVRRLAERITRNGFEITRALWVYLDEDKYMVFAGGTRFLAAQMVGLEEVPCVVHRGYTDAEIIRLAEEDNENDEYHDPVPITDVWASYKVLSEPPYSWTQAKIAEAKGVARSFVSYRISLANLPPAVLACVNTHNLTERQMLELLRLSTVDTLGRWMGREEAMLYIIERATGGGKKSATAKIFAAEVDGLNEAIAYAQDTLAGLDDVTLYDDGKAYTFHAGERFTDLLCEKEARTIAEVRAVEYSVRQHIAQNIKRHREWLVAQSAAADEAAAAVKPITVREGEWWQLGNHLLFCGDTASEGFKRHIAKAALAFADPPYNAGVDDWDNDFEWGHDWLIDRADIVIVTPGIASLFDFSRKTTMPYVWSLSCWIDNGMTRSPVGFGNWIYLALFSSGKVHRMVQDHIRISISSGQYDGFKGTKPAELMRWVVTTFAESGEAVIDPFAGSGSTLYACEQTGRKCITGEIDAERCAKIVGGWQEMTGGVAEVVNEVHTI